uniref:DUF19 domain-containing protein n=1 Tax=Panagrolaimus sp. ES5 TaxID=591445 RepID=A0AC34F573_9BILA
MKYLVSMLILLLFVIFEGAFGDNATNCTDKNIEQITTCYQNVMGDSTPALVFELEGPFAQSNVSKAFWKPYCERKQKLNDCIGKKNIQNCYNVENIRKLPFSYNDIFPLFLIANFIRLDYLCDKLFKLSETDYDCFLSEVQKAEKDCHDKNCKIQTAYKECGKVVGCFQRKSFAFLCDNNQCNGISSTNNPIDGLCHEDDDIQAN